MAPSPRAARKPSRPYHHGNLRRALLDEALATIGSDGVEGLTLREIGARVGVSRSALYRHFADKRALLAAVATEGFRTLCRELLAAWEEGGRGRAGFDAMGVAYVRFAVASPSHYRVMFGGFVGAEAGDADLRHRGRRRLPVARRRACRAAARRPRPRRRYGDDGEVRVGDRARRGDARHRRAAAPARRRLQPGTPGQRRRAVALRDRAAAHRYRSRRRSPFLAARLRVRSETCCHVSGRRPGTTTTTATKLTTILTGTTLNPVDVVLIVVFVAVVTLSWHVPGNQYATAA